MSGMKRSWLILSGTIAVAFFILGFFGKEVYRQAPPIPERVGTADGSLIFTREDILTGQQVWQSTGGQQLGSIWGHGAYQAPDWSADWLHREALALLGLGGAGRRTAVSRRCRPTPGRAAGAAPAELRTNTFDPATGTVTISADRRRRSGGRRALRRPVRRGPGPRDTARRLRDAGSHGSAIRRAGAR